MALRLLPLLESGGMPDLAHPECPESSIKKQAARGRPGACVLASRPEKRRPGRTVRRRRSHRPTDATQVTTAYIPYGLRACVAELIPEYPPEAPS